MESELDIIDSLTALKYNGKSLQNDNLTRALEGGVRSQEFREIVGWLTNELHVLRKTDEKLSPELNDPNEFSMELSALLKELACPYNQFVTGSLSERYESHESRMLLLDYLISELMATKMCLKLNPVDESYVIPKFTTNTAKALEQITRDLRVGKPPENIAPRALFDKLNFKLEETMRSTKPGILSEPLLRTAKPLTDEQWNKLEQLHSDLDAEYNLRRQVLLTRLEVTIQSFQWSEKMKNRENEISELYQRKSKEIEPFLHGGDDTNIVALLSARADLAIIEKTSSANVRKNTGSKIQKHVIGSVPDRGGRAHEHAPPPPEMPSWQQQRATGPGGRGGGGGGGNFRGGGGGNFRGGGNNRGGNAAGGGHWVQYTSAPQQQRPQYEQGRDQNWVSGSGRVQGSGWSQKGNEYNDRFDSGGSNNYQGGGGRGGSGGNYRGRSNYNRGGQRR